MKSSAKKVPSVMVSMFENFIEFGNRWFTLGGWLFKTGDNIFVKIEAMMAVITLLCFGILFWIDNVSFQVGFVVCLLLVQRVFEYVIVYSRNFILNHGRIFTTFKNKASRGQWLILMFQLNLIQLIVIFAIWYHFLSLNFPGAFTSSLGVLDAFYFSVTTFFTTGYGDITPISDAAKILTIIESMLAFYTLLIVMNGLISIHFNREE